MDNKATRPSLPQDTKEKWMSMPASSPRNNTQEAQAQTQDSFQPLDYFHGGERTISPPPDTLQKAMDPSLGCQLDISQPSTPAASSSSCLSRSSTLNSFGTIQTQDSDTTLCSYTSSSSDDTVSVPRSSTFPALRSYPVDRKSLPNGTNFHMVELHKSLYKNQKVFPFPIGGSVSTVQSIPSGEGIQTPKSQAPPSRHLTFPMEGPRSTTKTEETQSSVAEGNEERTIPEPSGLRNPLPKDMMISSTDMCYNLFKQEMPPDDPEFGSLQAQTDMFVKSRLATPERWMIGLRLDSKQAGLRCQLGPNPSLLSQRRKNLHRGRPISKARREPERGMSLASQNYQADRERPYSPDNIMFSAASTIANSEATLEPEDFRSEPRMRPEEFRESGSSSPGLTNKSCCEDNQEPSSQDSDDDTSFLHEDCSPANEEDEDTAYDKLVENIINLVLESSCVGNVEERAVPIELYVHNFLEQILNHPKPATESETLGLPIRNLPVQNNEAPCDAGDADMRARSQGINSSGGGGNKRKNKEAPGPGRNRGYGDEDNFGDSSEEDEGNSSQHAKKLKTGKKSRNFSCPFRKRNPIRFNVRDHGSCALNPFADFALLKRHIKTSHQRTKGLISCVRCKEPFTDQAALKYHLTQPESCSLLISTGDEDPEDGITDEVDRALKVRTKDDNIRSWKALWNYLFPGDNLDDVPGPDHEPPVELDEVQHHAYKGDSVREFVCKQTIDGEAGMTDHGFRYMVEVARQCRDKRSHKPCKGRLERDDCFVHTVHTELYRRQCTFQPQQTHPLGVRNPPHGAAPTHWEPNLNDPLSLGAGMPLLDGDFSYPIMTGFGNDFGINATQVPAPDPNPSSEGAVQHAAPQDAPTAFPYKDMLAQNDRPCSAAGGSAGRSSGPSSQSHDSGYQTSQEQIAAALLHHHHQHADDARPGGYGCDCSFSTALGGIPGQHATIPGQGPSDLCGVGTGPLMPQECGDAGSNSEEGFSPLG